MNDEPQLNEINEDDSEPAAKGDIRAAVNQVAQATNNAISSELEPIRLLVAAGGWSNIAGWLAGSAIG